MRPTGGDARFTLVYAHPHSNENLGKCSPSPPSNDLSIEYDWETHKRQGGGIHEKEGEELRVH